MALDAGGHLTHGFRPEHLRQAVPPPSYGVDPTTCLLDYDDVRRRAHEERPLILIAGYSSYPGRVNFRIFREIADEVGATFMVDMAHFAGLVAGKVLTGDYDPVPHAHIVTTTTHKTLRGPRGGLVLCDRELAPSSSTAAVRWCSAGRCRTSWRPRRSRSPRRRSRRSRDYAARVVDERAGSSPRRCSSAGVTVVTGGTDNHLVLVDVRPFGLNGRQAEAALRAAGITLNRNVDPRRHQRPVVHERVAPRHAAVTTLGMGAAEMREIAEVIHMVLSATSPGTIGSGPNAGQRSRVQFQLDESVRDRARAQVADLLHRHPLYPDIEL